MTDVHIVWVSFHEGIAHAGYWDEGIIEAAFDGTLWRPAGLPNFVHHFDFDELPPGAGAVVVVPARWHTTDLVRLNTCVTPLPWCLLILAGDEQSSFPWGEVIHPNMRVWVQTPRPGLHDGADRLLGDGWPPNCRATLAGLEDLAAHRELAWSFAGQINNADREACHTALVARQAERGDGEVHATRIFGSGMPYPDYMRLLATTKVVPCPSGCFSVDTFRLFEALEAGCVPVAAAVAPTEPVDGYWPFLFGEDPPFPIIDDWTRFGEVCDTIVADWPAVSNRVFAWWQGVKRRIAHDLMADLTALGAVGEPEFDPCHHITVLVPTSPIPSHPDTAIIEATIASIRERLPTAEIIVMVDGVRDEQANRRGDYAEYTRRLLWKANHEWVNVLPVVFDEHLHQAAMTRRCLSMVRTETILFVEHDTPLCGEQVPWALFLGAIGSGDVNIIRLHHEAAIHPSHRHLMLGTEPQWVAGVPLLRTVQYSQRPHIASTAFYRKMIATYFGADARTMIEDVVYGALSVAWNEFAERGWRDFRLWMYAPDGDMKRSTHTDGRGEDPKFAMRFAYDGDTPLGAPRPTRDPEPAVVVHRSDVRLAVFGARADRRGLAIQSTEVCRHLHPAAVFGIDMGELSPYPNDWSDYDPATLTVVTNERVNREMVRDWLTTNDIDVVWCADDETEILTQRGWLTCDEVQIGDVALTLTADHLSEWQPITNVSIFPSKTRRMLSIESRGHSSLTTEDHRWLVRHQMTGRMPHHIRQENRVRTSSQLTGADRIPRSAPCINLPTEPKYTDALVELVAWAFTEGHIIGGGALSITQSHVINPENCARIRGCLTEVFGPAVERCPRAKKRGVLPPPAWRESVAGRNAVFHLNTLAGRTILEHAPQRVVTRAFIHSLTKAQLQLFVDVAMLADNHGPRAFSQASADRLEAFELACICLGKGISRRNEKHQAGTPRYTTSIYKSRYTYLDMARREWVEKECRVWCPTTPNGSWFARRRNTMFYTGNSAETFYFDWFTGLAAECGVRTVLAPNPEFFSHVASWPPLPDVLAAPTRWRIGDMPGAILLPHPVDRERLKFRQRTEASTFLMVVGHLATRDRQGTRILWEALNHVTQPVRVIIRSQRDLCPPHAYGSHIELDIRCGDVADYWDLYAEGDVFIHPRRYGGNDLPLLEALSCGMPVLATDASPQRGFLPAEMLLPCSSDRVFRSLVGDLALHDVNPWGLATRIDALASDPAEVARLSLLADEVAQRFSWEAQRPEWETVFARVVAGERLTA